MSTGFEAFRYQEITPNGPAFARAFLSSYDFDVKSLKNICKELGISSHDSKNALADSIVRKLQEDPNTARVIMRHLVARSRTAFAVCYVGHLDKPARGEDAIDLVQNRGYSTWYGPLTRNDDPQGNYYVYPIYVDYSEPSEDPTSIERVKYWIRWLVFARIGNGILSLHWHGFTYQNQDNLGNRKSRAQFPYWREIPSLFESIGVLLSIKVRNIKYQSLILETVLERYRGNPEYRFKDDRIRAEAGSVALNVRAGASQSGYDPANDTDSQDGIQDIGDVAYLAITIRKAIEYELKEMWSPSDSGDIDEVIMITLIKNFGTQSYGLRIDDPRTGMLFHAHCYFGSKPNSSTPDHFPHFQLKGTSELSDLKQLRFLIGNFDRERHLE